MVPQRSIDFSSNQVLDVYDAAKTTFAVRYRELVDLMGMDAFKRGVRRGIRRNGFRLRTHDVSDSESADINPALI